MTKYVESGHEAFAWLRAQLLDTRHGLTAQVEMTLIQQVQRRFGLSERTAALLLREALASLKEG